MKKMLGRSNVKPPNNRIGITTTGKSKSVCTFDTKKNVKCVMLVKIGARIVPLDFLKAIVSEYQCFDHFQSVSNDNNRR